MNCCDEYAANYGCRQGRDCPARVAPVGQRYPAAAPLPPSKAPALLKRATWVALSGVLGLLFYGWLLLALVVD